MGRIVPLNMATFENTSKSNKCALPPGVVFRERATGRSSDAVVWIALPCHGPVVLANVFVLDSGTSREVDGN